MYAFQFAYFIILTGILILIASAFFQDFTSKKTTFSDHIGTVALTIITIGVLFPWIVALFGI